uniref:SURF1-like protein n=1 Tax=Spongospora subterranea TaxID=70186 RepID=A0A0H5RER7_9EUKA|eukprot:CRZ12528.1 hypothetical protein [Spongospora subterranea]
MDVIGCGVFSMCSAGTAALGAWQLQRRREKVAQIEARRAQLDGDAIPLTDRPVLWSKVALPPGRYDRQQFLVGPRGGPSTIATDHGSSGISTGGLGYQIIAPFTASDGSVYLVNRGWCQRKSASLGLESLADEPIAGQVGVARPYERILGSAPPPSNIFVSMDAPEMMSRISPDSQTDFFVDLLESNGNSVGGVLHRKRIDDFLHFPTSPEKHVAYAFTWFALSAAVATMTVIRFRKRSKQTFSR